MTALNIKGNPIDNETRCIHYHSVLDIIAIKFKCCNAYYPCYNCHQEEAGHPSAFWKINEQHQKAILCGKCKQEMTISQYLNCSNQCIFCRSKFNPKCAEHYHLYFEE